MSTTWATSSVNPVVVRNDTPFDPPPQIATRLPALVRLRRKSIQWARISADVAGNAAGWARSRGEVVLLGRGGLPPAGLGVLDDVLVVIREVDPRDVEASAAEQSRVRAECKIGTVLEINVPKCPLGQHTP